MYRVLRNYTPRFYVASFYVLGSMENFSLDFQVTCFSLHRVLLITTIRIVKRNTSRNSIVLLKNHIKVPSVPTLTLFRICLEFAYDIICNMFTYRGQTEGT